VQLALQFGQPLARQLMPQERPQPVLGDGLESWSQVSEPSAVSAVAGHALVLGAQPPQRRRHRGLGSLVHAHSLVYQPIGPQAKHPGGDVHTAGYGRHTR
jgi:hypothetical protein